jgi:hypothetical protein
VLFRSELELLELELELLELLVFAPLELPELELELFDPLELPEPDLVEAEAGAVEQEGVALGVGLLVAIQVLPFQYHHRQLLLSWYTMPPK